MPRRIVACQGSIQLVTAVAVLRQRDRDGGARWNDHLLITGLHAPAGQEQAFVSALERMAGALHAWTSVVHLADAAEAKFEDVREVYVVREWQRSNQALLSAFPAATKICFGDSIGIYLSPGYMAPRQGWVRRFAGHLRRRVAAQPVAAADCYYLVLPTAFDPVPSRNVRQTDAALLRQAISDLRPLVPQSLVADLRRRLGERRLVVVVGSNFSEQGVMSPEAEVAAYVEYLAQQALDPDSLVLLKPHPRDRKEKIVILEAALRRTHQHVLTLTDALAWYLPLETLLLEIRPPEQAHHGVELCTFSSACLAPKYMLDIRPRIGFGAQLVRRYFSKAFVEPRLRHERQLVMACAR